MIDHLDTIVVSVCNQDFVDASTAMPIGIKSVRLAICKICVIHPIPCHRRHAALDGPHAADARAAFVYAKQIPARVQRQPSWTD